MSDASRKTWSPAFAAFAMRQMTSMSRPMRGERCLRHNVPWACKQRLKPCNVQVAVTKSVVQHTISPRSLELKYMPRGRL